jgi:SET domain-containing protein 6
MYWEDDEIESLNPSLVVSRIGKQQAEETFHRLIPDALIDLGIGNLQISLDQFHQVASTILSYSFDVERPDFNEEEEDDEIVKSDGYFKSMIALADTLNSDSSLCNANLFYETEFLIMKSIKTIEKGEQIYNIYGEHPNSELLRRYGYVEWNSSKYDFGKIRIENIKESIKLHFMVSDELLTTLLNMVSQNEVDEIEEELVLDSYDIYIDGETIPEFTILVQVLTTLFQLNRSLDFQSMTFDELTKTVNRTLKKCYQLIESGSITRESLLLFELIVQSRLSEYPSHAFRKFVTPLILNDYSNKIKMSERILKSEVESLQNFLKLLNDGNIFKLVGDEKLNRNILKRKVNDNDQKVNKKQRL